MPNICLFSGMTDTEMHERLHRFRERHYAAQERETFSAKKRNPQEVDSFTFHVFIVPQVLVLGPGLTTIYLNAVLMRQEDYFLWADFKIPVEGFGVEILYLIPAP